MCESPCSPYMSEAAAPSTNEQSVSDWPYTTRTSSWRAVALRLPTDNSTLQETCHFQQHRDIQ